MKHIHSSSPQFNASSSTPVEFNRQLYTCAHSHLGHDFLTHMQLVNTACIVSFFHPVFVCFMMQLRIRTS